MDCCNFILGKAHDVRKNQVDGVSDKHVDDTNCLIYTWKP